MAVIVSNYASKADIAKLDTRIAQTDASVARLETSIAKFETSLAKTVAAMIKWYIATSMALTGLVFGIARYVR